MALGRHSYVRFWPSDWLAGTARMTRVHRSVYFDICCYNWDKNEPCPQTELTLMLLDLENGSAVVAQLIAAGKLIQDERGVFSPRALEEAEYAFDQWEKRSRGGKAYRPSKEKSKSVTKSVPSLIVSNNQNQNQNQNQKEKKERGQPTLFEPDLPPYLPAELWVEFLAMRKAMKKSPTAYAQRRLLSKLADMHKRGLDVATVVEKSIVNNWPDVYEPNGRFGEARRPEKVGAWQTILRGD